MSDDGKPLVLRAQDIDKAFKGVRALKGVGLNLFAGEVHGLNGENGAGKSTLIKIITGFYQPDGGQLLLEGKPVSFAKPLDSQQAGIATVYQEVNLIPERTVADNILLGREPRRAGLLDKKAALRQVQDILNRYDLRIDSRSRISELGLGVQQMVAIVRSVAFKAKVVILDEPTSALNGNEIEILFRVIRQLRAEGTAILFVSHRMSELYELCDRFTVLRDGEFITEATPSELPRPALVKAMLGSTGFEEGVLDRKAAKERSKRIGQEELGLSVRNLTWGTRVRDVSFDVRRGEILGLLGLLGSGRTETCKSIFGAVRAGAGEVEVDGRPVKRPSPARSLSAGLSYLSEDRRTEGLFPGLSVKENMSAAILKRISTLGFVRTGAQQRVVKEFTEELRIKVTNPEQPISELSGGNQQKVLLGRWLSLGPKAVLLDDPTRGIDIGAKAEVHRVIRGLADKGIAVVVTSSETEELLNLCDRLVVLTEGEVTGEVYPHEIGYDDVIRMLSGPVQPNPVPAGGAE